VGQLIDADRGHLFQYSEDGGRESSTHEWCREGIESRGTTTQNVDTASFPYFSRRLLRPSTVLIPDVAELPEEATPERAIYESAGTRSGCEAIPSGCAR